MHEVAESAGGRYLISGIGRSTDPIHHLRVFIPLPRVYETTDERELEAAWLKRFSNSSTWVLQLRKGYDTDEAVPPGSYCPTAPLVHLLLEVTARLTGQQASRAAAFRVPRMAASSRAASSSSRSQSSTGLTKPGATSTSSRSSSVMERARRLAVLACDRPRRHGRQRLAVDLEPCLVEPHGPQISMSRPFVREVLRYRASNPSPQRGHGLIVLGTPRASTHYRIEESGCLRVAVPDWQVEHLTVLAGQDVRACISLD